MDNEKLKKQMRDMCIAADGLATAMHLFYANVSSDILDDIIAQAERENIHHCGQDAVNFEQLSDNLTDTYKDYCRGVFEQFLSREITWTKFVEKVALPFCHENVNEFVNAIKDSAHHCGQDATVQDPNESQPADAVPESIKELVGMQIVSVFPPGWKCQGCAYDSDYFRCEKKVELVGGYMLCLAQIPIVTE